MAKLTAGGAHEVLRLERRRVSDFDRGETILDELVLRSDLWILSKTRWVDRVTGRTKNATGWRRSHKIGPTQMPSEWARSLEADGYKRVTSKRTGGGR